MRFTGVQRTFCWLGPHGSSSCRPCPFTAVLLIVWHHNGRCSGAMALWSCHRDRVQLRSADSFCDVVLVAACMDFGTALSLAVTVVVAACCRVVSHAAAMAGVLRSLQHQTCFCRHQGCGRLRAVTSSMSSWHKHWQKQ